MPDPEWYDVCLDEIDRAVECGADVDDPDAWCAEYYAASAAMGQDCLDIRQRLFECYLRVPACDTSPCGDLLRVAGCREPGDAGADE